MDIEECGRNSATAAARILHEESPANMEIPPKKVGPPQFDWRELQRWGISEARLPAGSVVRFRQPGLWERYWWLVSGGGLLLAAEAALTVGLLVHRAKRRHGESVAKLIADLSSRFINLIASDHAPHTRREKDVPFGQAPSGIPGVETMLPLLFSEYLGGSIHLLSLIEKTSWNPAEILGIPRQVFLPGERADFAIFGDSTVPVNADALHSRAGWTPYEGFPAVFPDLVILGGAPAYRGGEFLEASPCWYPGRGYHP